MIESIPGTKIYKCETCNQLSRFPDPLPENVLCLMCSWCWGGLLHEYNSDDEGEKDD